MPFVSDKQRRACFAIMRRYNEQGLKAPWDCHEYAKNSNKKSKKKSTRKSSSKKIFEGPRGGKYKMVRNKKVYL